MLQCCRKRKGSEHIKALIISVSTGQGHNSTASALQSVFIENGWECRTIDAHYHAFKPLGFCISKGYLLTIKCISGLYAKTYTKLEQREAGKGDLTIKLGKMIAGKIGKYIDEYSPDVIICTHVFSGLTVQHLINQGKINARTFGIVTDFTLHPYWEELLGFDGIVIPCEKLEDRLIAKGFKKDQILPFGIPIHSKFSGKLSKEAAREQLGLMKDKPVITVMSGSMCYGGVTETVKKIDRLNECFQIVAVCGSSKKELKKLENTNFRHNVKKLGYTDLVNLIMDSSDIIITKPGGLSTTEALSKELPMIITKPIRGHEERNLAFLTEQGAAMSVTESVPVELLVHEFFTNKEMRENMQRAVCEISKKDAAKKFFNYVNTCL